MSSALVSTNNAVVASVATATATATAANAVTDTVTSAKVAHVSHCDTCAIVLAGGSGQRFGYELGKQYLEVNGLALAAYSLLAFLHPQRIKRIRLSLIIILSRR